MQPEELFKRAREMVDAVPPSRGPLDAAVERFRAECAAFFDLVPEPPVYRRIDDPARRVAEGLLPRAEALWASCLALKRDGATGDLDKLAEALWANVAALCHVAAGRVAQAEEAYAKAVELERAAVTPRRLWVRSDEKRAPVFDPKSGLSRYDPLPAAALTVKLACPNHTCQLQADFSLSPSYATHRFVCPGCRQPFVGYFGEARGVELEQKSPKVRRYVFRIEELDGGLARVEFEDQSGGDLTVARRDLLCFLYTEGRELRGVLNLSSGKLLWVQPAGGCFIATVAFGEGAPELLLFRLFRDRVLLQFDLGAWLVRAYYRFGPGAAVLVAQVRPLGALVRGGLRLVYGLLEKVWRREGTS